MTSGAPSMGRGWLWAARGAWLVTAVLTLALFAAAVPLRFTQLQSVCAGAACTGLQLTLDDIRTLQSLSLPLSTYAGYHLALELAFAAVHFALAFAIFARRSDDWTAIFVSLTLITFGAATFSGTLSALAPQPWAWRLPMSLVSPLPDALPAWLAPPSPAWALPATLVLSLGQVCAGLFFYIFPSGRFVPRWTALAAALWLLWEAPAILAPASRLSPENWPALASGGTWALFMGSFLFAQVYRFRHVSDPVQRQQTKWVVYGVVMALGGFVGSFLLGGLLRSLGLSGLVYRVLVGALAYGSMLALPVSIGLAISRSRLWQIDFLINRTLVYALLSGVLAVVYFATVIVLQTVLQPFFGKNENETLLVLSTLAIAALFNPVKEGAQRLIDRRFYRGRYDAAQTLKNFSAAMRNEMDLERLSGDLLAVVEHTMRPAHASLWLTHKPGASQEEGKTGW